MGDLCGLRMDSSISIASNCPFVVTILFGVNLPFEILHCSTDKSPKRFPVIF